MKKDYIIDYASFIGFKALVFLAWLLPKGVNLYFGRRLGDLLYYLNPGLRARTYANIKTAFRHDFARGRLNEITRNFFRNFGQNLIEIFFIPSINKEYINKYISVSGAENVFAALEKGRGAVLLGVHGGSWELSNVICANLGFPFRVLVRPQSKFGRVERLLNLYRTQKGCKIIQRKNQTRQLIDSLKNNEAVGMTADQGGKTGTLVDFFGKEASMATGALRLALKYGVPVLPSFYVRIKGPYTKVIIGEPFEVRVTEDAQKDLRDNLKRLTQIFEKYIRMYPQEYLWSYKVWKYGRVRDILILSDGKAGHLNQSQAVANIISADLMQRGFRVKVEALEIKFRSRFSKFALSLCACLTGKYLCQGCLSCLRRFLDSRTCDDLAARKPDLIISCGSQTAAVNFLVARENLARSVAIMKPSVLSTKKFDLVIMSRHDNPPKRKNIVVTQAALNLIDEGYLLDKSARFLSSLNIGAGVTAKAFGLLIGGDSKNFRLSLKTTQEVISQVKKAAEKLNADVLVTTSRRTNPGLEDLVKREFKDYPRCRALIIANENNLPEAVGGILGSSSAVIVSPESISMVSEAISSKKYVLVFNEQGLSAKHKSFLGRLAVTKNIYLEEANDLGARIEEVMRDKPDIVLLNDNLKVSEAIKRIL